MLGRPQSYFVDADGILRSIQIGDLTDADFERQYAAIAGGVTRAVADGRAAIEVVGLRKAYGGRAVLRDVSFGVGAGEIFALLGPNGAGKTTTVEIIEGYRRADARRRSGCWASIRRRAGRAHRARVGLMLQGGGGIDPRMTGPRGRPAPRPVPRRPARPRRAAASSSG